MSLLDQFLAEEGTSYVRHLLREAFDAGSASAALARKEFEFNRFDVTLDFEQGVAVIEDVLDSTDAGSLRVPLGRFSAALE